MKKKIAVGAGYYFTLVTEDELEGINVRKTETVVSVEGENYPLYKGETFFDSRKIDNIMDRIVNKDLSEMRIETFEQKNLLKGIH